MRAKWHILVLPTEQGSILSTWGKFAHVGGTDQLSLIIPVLGMNPPIDKPLQTSW
jgi:hypothetical protein